MLIPSYHINMRCIRFIICLLWYLHVSNLTCEAQISGERSALQQIEELDSQLRFSSAEVTRLQTELESIKKQDTKLRENDCALMAVGCGAFFEETELRRGKYKYEVDMAKVHGFRCTKLGPFEDLAIQRLNILQHPAPVKIKQCQKVLYVQYLHFRSRYCSCPVLVPGSYCRLSPAWRWRKRTKRCRRVWTFKLQVAQCCPNYSLAEETGQRHGTC